MDSQQVAILIRDAMSSFIGVRQDSWQYVNSRYPDWTPEQKREKQRQVELRVAMAEKLHSLSNIIANKIASDLRGRCEECEGPLDEDGSERICHICSEMGGSGACFFCSKEDCNNECMEGTAQ